MATCRYRDFDRGVLLKEGDFGKVFACFDRRDGNKKYAMKVIDLQKSDEDGREMLERGAAVLMDMKHDFILHAVSSFHQDGALIIVTEFCDQGNLDEFLERRNGKLLKEPRIVEWARQMCSALEYLYSKNVLHRDVKTQNFFLIGEQMKAKLGGFGMAKVLQKSMTRAVTFCGSPYYMSPEMLACKPYDSKNDIWALGVCIYEMATLEKPFDATIMQQLVFKIVLGQLPPMPKERYSKELINVMEKMMCRDPEKRPSAAELLDDVLFKKHTFPKKEDEEESSDTDLIFDFVSGKIIPNITFLAVELECEEEVDNIQMKYHNHPKEQIFQLLLHWKRRTTNTDYIFYLKRILQRIDRADVVNDIELFDRKTYHCQNIPDSLKLVTKKEICLLAKHITTEFSSCLRFIGVDEVEMERIKQDHPNKAQQQITICFQNMQERGSLSRQIVCDGLTYVKRNDIVQKLIKEWQ